MTKLQGVRRGREIASVMSGGSDDFEAIKEKLARLTSLAKGERSIIKYSADSGVCRELIGKLASGTIETKPTRTTIMKLTDSLNARPRNGISANDFLVVCGYPVLKKAEKSAHGITAENLIAQTYTPSPSLAMAMLIDYLCSEKKMNDFNVSAHGGWFQIKGTGNTSDEIAVGISAFCNSDKGITAMKIAIKALLLDTVSDIKYSSGLDKKTYYFVTDTDDIYDFCLSLPWLGVKQMVILKADNAHRYFEEKRIRSS